MSNPGLLKYVNKYFSDLMNLLPVADSSNFVSVEVNAKEAILGAQDHPVLIDETG